MSDSNDNPTEVPATAQPLLRLIRWLLTVLGLSVILIGIVFLTATIAFAKKGELFVRGELYAGVAFLVCGSTLCMFARRRLRDHNRTEFPAPPRPERVGVGLISVALILPVLGGGVLLFVTSFGLALAISATTVLVSSILLAVDAHRLGNVDLIGRRRESAVVLLLGMFLLWIIAYPFAFFRRRHFGGPNLAIPAIVVALFFVVGPILRALLVPPGLPSCTSREVVQLLEQVIRGTPVGANTKSIDGHREISYDREANRRQGQCVVHTEGQDIVVNYLVEWLDRDKGQFAVRIPPADLPSCTSREVVQLLEQVIRSTPVGAKTKSIDGHREISYDREANRRQGECVVHTEGQDIVVNYLVEWLDREKGQFAVRTTEE